MSTIRTHQDMLQFLESKAPGMIVLQERIQGAPGEDTESKRRFGYMKKDKTAMSQGCHVYSLPCDPDMFEKTIKTMLETLS